MSKPIRRIYEVDVMGLEDCEFVKLLDIGEPALLSWTGKVFILRNLRTLEILKVLENPSFMKIYYIDVLQTNNRWFLVLVSLVAENPACTAIWVFV